MAMLSLITAGLLGLTLAQPSHMLFRDPLDLFSFDYSAHKAPLAFTTHKQSVELVSKVKLIPAVKGNTHGAFTLNKVKFSKPKSVATGDPTGGV